MSVPFWKTLFEEAMRDMRYEEVLPVLRQAYRDHPEDALALAYGSVLEHAIPGESSLFHRWIMDRQVKRLYRRLLRRKPDAPEVLAAMGHYYWRRNSSKAIRYYQRWVNLEPMNASSWNAFANTLKIVGRVSEAGVAYRRAIELQSTFGPLYNYLKFLFEQKELDEIRSVFPRVLSSFNELPESESKRVSGEVIRHIEKSTL